MPASSSTYPKSCKYRSPSFFEGAPGGVDGTAESPSYVNEFLATSDGLALAKSFMRIENSKLRRLIVHLVEDCAEL